MSTAPLLKKLVQLLSKEERGSYDKTATRLKEARDVFHECVALQLQDPLNEEFHSMPSATLEEKKTLVKWVNNELRSFGVAIRCPNTDKASSLAAGPLNSGDAGRFRLFPIGDSQRRTFNSTQLFDLKLVPHFERRESLAELWVDRSSHKRNERHKS